MIAIGCATTDERAFRAAGAPTIEAIDEGDSLLMRHHGFESIDVPFNEMIAAAAAREDLEALLLVHQDALLEPKRDLPRLVRELLVAEKDLAMVWAAAKGFSMRHRDDVSATLLALSPWTVQKLRFDPTVGGSADASAEDLALQAQAAGRCALPAKMGVVRSRMPQPPATRRRELQARVEVRRKWDRMPATSTDPPRIT